MIIETKFEVGQEIYIARFAEKEKQISISGPWKINRIYTKESNFNGENWSIEDRIYYGFDGHSPAQFEKFLYTSYKEAETAMRKLMS